MQDEESEISLQFEEISEFIAPLRNMMEDKICTPMRITNRVSFKVLGFRKVNCWDKINFEI